MAFRTKIVWEKQDYETVELTFDLEGESREVGTAFTIEDGKPGLDPDGPVWNAGLKLTESLLALVTFATVPRGDLLRLTVSQVGDGVVMAIYGSPAKPVIRSMDVDDDVVKMNIAVMFEAALVFAGWKGLREEAQAD